MNPCDIEQLLEARKKYPDYFDGVKVLELGSRNINGSVKEVFKNYKWTGVDWVKGKDVDVICKAHETNFKPNTFDVLISYSAFEHDPFWEESIGHNLPALKPGGLILFSWGGPNSAPHGLHYSADIEGEPTGAFTGTADLTGDEPIGGYYPKSMEEMEEFLTLKGIKVLDKGTKDTGCGETLWLIGKKEVHNA